MLVVFVLVLDVWISISVCSLVVVDWLFGRLLGCVLCDCGILLLLLFYVIVQVG